MHPLLSRASCLVLCLSCAACGADVSSELGAGANDDPSFGNGADDQGADAGVTSDAAAAPGGDGETGDAVRVRLLHGLVNVAAVTACHDPDLVLDRPDTAENEGDEGALPAVPLALAGGFGEASAYALLEPHSTGAITLHRAADGSDAGVGEPDAGSPPACTPETREAVLPLPFDARWLDPAEPPDLARLGIATSLRGGDTLTLLASGVALDAEVLDQRARNAESVYLFGHPGDLDGAKAAGRAERALLLARRGALLVPSEKLPIDAGRVGLAFAHLIPDVPSQFEGSGALRLCAKADDVELGELRSTRNLSLAFRMRSPLDVGVEPDRGYTFRAYAAEPFDTEAKDCAGTSLLPVAELVVPKGVMRAGRSYSLVALGAISADELCAPTTPESLTRPGCTASSESLSAHLALVPE